MKKSYLDFINDYNVEILNEGFSEKSIEKAIKLISKILSGKIKGLLPLNGLVINKNGNKEVYSKQFIVKTKSKSSMFQINWVKSSDSTEVYSIDFFKSLDLLFKGKAKSDLTVYTLGKSIVYFLPIIWTIENSQKYDLSEKEAIELGRLVFKNDKVKESRYFIDNLSYILFEGIDIEHIDDLYEINKMFEDEDVDSYRSQKRKERDEAYFRRHDSQENMDKYQQLNKEYNELMNAIAGGATTLKDLQVAIKKDISVSYIPTKEEESAEKKLKESTEDPEKVFKKMSGYVNMVINGINPSIILCGAPGVGKTFRVKQQLKSNGYSEGKNMFTIKGKCTPRVLYSTLYEYKKKKDIVVIDDADGLVGPKAPEDCINILKAALDSTSDEEGKLVSYGIAGKIINDDGQELPKKFYYNGSIIIITNYNAGQLDTALRGRSFIQDIHFSTEDLLKIIHKLMPALASDTLSTGSKIKAYDYLKDLAEAKSKMEISIRTFIICAKIFESCSEENGFSDEDCRAMIKEQMELQAERRMNNR